MRITRLKLLSCACILALASASLSPVASAQTDPEALKKQIQAQALLQLLQQKQQEQINDNITKSLTGKKEEEVKKTFNYEGIDRVFAREDMPQRVFNNIEEVPIP